MAVATEQDQRPVAHSSSRWRYAILLAAIGTFSFSLLVGLVRLGQENHRAEATSQELIYWSAAQLSLEYWRLLDALGVYAAGAPAVTKDDLATRIDIIWSRLGVYDGGLVGKRLSSVEGSVETVTALAKSLREVEPAIMALAKGDTAAYAPIRARLGAHGGSLFRLAQRTNLYEQSAAIEFREATGRTFLALTGFLLGVLGAGAVLIALLISESRRATRALAAARTAETRAREDEVKAVAANRAKTDFLHNMGHELRTPLNAIIGFSEIMETEALGPIGTPKYAEFAKDIRVSGGNLLAIINDILDLEAIEAGDYELENQEVDLAQAIEFCLRLVADRAKRAGHIISSVVSEDFVRLRADDRAVKQILLNLLSNAIKFTANGGKIFVAAEIDESGAPRLMVADNGIGIAEHDLQKVLANFGQADSGLARVYEGAGLGLPLVQWLATLHGGTLCIESEFGAGTVATVTFPPERNLKRQPDAVPAGAVGSANEDYPMPPHAAPAHETALSARAS